MGSTQLDKLYVLQYLWCVCTVVCAFVCICDPYTLKMFFFSIFQTGKKGVPTNVPPLPEGALECSVCNYKKTYREDVPGDKQRAQGAVRKHYNVKHLGEKKLR